jgi:hypothetical protein
VVVVVLVLVLVLVLVMFWLLLSYVQEHGYGIVRASSADYTELGNPIQTWGVHSAGRQDTCCSPS